MTGFGNFGVQYVVSKAEKEATWKVCNHQKLCQTIIDKCKSASIVDHPMESAFSVTWLPHSQTNPNGMRLWQN